MYTKDIALPFTPFYHLDKYYETSTLLFFDIETTGLSALTSFLYLIGCVYCTGETWHLRQWLAEELDDEEKILIEFSSFLAPRQILLEYNGNRFDIPFLQDKYRSYEMADPFAGKDTVDLYKKAFSYRRLISTPNLKQGTLETYFGGARKDPFSGKDLIPVYRQFLTSQEEELKQQLLLHNHEDLTGMMRITGVLAFDDLMNGRFTLQNIKVDEEFLELHFKPDFPLPSRLSFSSDYFLLDTRNGVFVLKLFFFTGELRYFHENYKEYYYLPGEDMAIHKSVASYVEKEFREPAKASNCYTRKQGTFLPQLDHMFTPAFKMEKGDKTTYFLYSEDLLAREDDLKRCVFSCLKHIMLNSSHIEKETAR